MTVDMNLTSDANCSRRKPFRQHLMLRRVHLAKHEARNAKSCPCGEQEIRSMKHETNPNEAMQKCSKKPFEILFVSAFEICFGFRASCFLAGFRGSPRHQIEEGVTHFAGSREGEAPAEPRPFDRQRLGGSLTLPIPAWSATPIEDLR